MVNNKKTMKWALHVAAEELTLLRWLDNVCLADVLVLGCVGVHCLSMRAARCRVAVQGLEIRGWKAAKSMYALNGVAAFSHFTSFFFFFLPFSLLVCIQ